MDMVTTTYDVDVVGTSKMSVWWALYDESRMVD